MANNAKYYRELAQEAWDDADGLIDSDPIALRELAYKLARGLELAANEVENRDV